MIDRLRTLKGHLQGYGGCLHCHHTWNWKKGYLIPYAASKHKTHLDGSPYYYAHMFPLCEECYESLSPQERFNYCKELYGRWGVPDKHVDWNIVSEHVGLRLSTQSTIEEVEK